jgi:hypothetical protein
LDIAVVICRSVGVVNFQHILSARYLLVIDLSRAWEN